MSLSLYQRDFGYCLKQASDWLGGPVCALLFPWNLEQLLRKRMRLLARRGLGAAHALVQVAEDRAEGEISVGMEMYELPTPEQPIRLVHVVLPYLRASSCVPDFWAVAEADYKRASRSVRRLGRRSARACAPVMPAADRDRLWRNTVGFLLGSRQEFRRFRIPKKRGVLLSGAPGAGKTMACRWLRGECRRHGLRWRNVTVADYQLAREQHGVSSLFHLDRPGIVLFDDLDFGIRDRQTTGASADHSTFLAELDGVVGRRGAVYLFTSNAALAELDSAFRRPGRIDVVMEFAQPNATLRAQFIAERWQSDICEAIDIDEVIADTDGLSFADLEELRKLLVLHYLEHQTWDWPRTWRIFRRGRASAAAGERIGFGAKNTADEEMAVRSLSGSTCGM
jgi:hypothetical protein